MLTLIFVGYLAITGLFYFNQENLMFFPDKTPLSKCYLLKVPAITYHETKENDQVVRYLKYTQENAKANVILFHGNGGGACHRGIFMEKLKASPVNIILAEYPGYGGDDSKFSEKIFLENAQALFNSVNKEGLPIFLLGESLGSGIATYLAAKNEIMGLILHNPYTSISEVGQQHYFWLPVSWLNKNSFKSKIWAKEVKVTPLVIQGDQDKTIPTNIVEKQLKNFPQKPLYQLVKGAAHNDLLSHPQVFEYSNQYLSNLLLEIN